MFGKMKFNKYLKEQQRKEHRQLRRNAIAMLRGMKSFYNTARIVKIIFDKKITNQKQLEPYLTKLK